MNAATWPGRWKGTSALTWLRQRLHGWAERAADGHIWRVVRRLELGHPLGRMDYAAFEPGVRESASDVLRGWAAQKRGMRAEIIIDFLAWLIEQAAPEQPRAGTRCHLCDQPASRPHTELSCWQHRAALWETRYRAEAGLPITGWWRDLHAAPQELVWFAELPAEQGRDEPWCASVWHDEAGPWRWDLSWEPSQAHRTERQIEAGQHVVAWQAMEHALAAWDRRPRGKGVACPRCYGWGYTCEHGGGPAHPCDDEAACECTACDGGIRAARPEGTEEV